jgi:hypothetical protein
MTVPDPTAATRRAAYLILTVIGVAICVAKIVGAENVVEPSRYKPPTPQSHGADRDDPPTRVWPPTRPEPTPMFSSNDKSRWATVRALVDEGTYVIGRRENFRDTEPPFKDTGIIFEDGYGSLDKVMNPETGVFFSRKPPLYPTLLALQYRLLKELLGWSIDRDRWWVVCTILLTVNALPFALYLLLLARLIEDYGTTDFGRLFVFATAAFATFYTTFSVTLNNHTPAMVCVLLAVYPLLRRFTPPLPPHSRRERGIDFAVSGFFAGLAVTFELPAAAFAAGLAVPLLIARTTQTLAFFLPAFLLPIAALLVCNYAALGTLIPAYAEFGGPWYNFPGSHWAKLELAQQGIPQRGIDFAMEPKHVYLFHMLFGHHGWFSLTPVWLLALGGLVGAAARGWPDVRRVFASATDGPVWTFRLLLAMTLVVSIVVFAFFTYKTNNYGGFTSGLRWVFWLTPLWLLATLPAADWVSRSRFGRGLAVLLLGFAVLSVFYPAWNPWRPPWILQLAELQGWVQY